MYFNNIIMYENVNFFPLEQNKSTYLINKTYVSKFIYEIMLVSRKHLCVIIYFVSHKYEINCVYLLTYHKLCRLLHRRHIYAVLKMLNDTLFVFVLYLYLIDNARVQIIMHNYCYNIFYACNVHTSTCFFYELLIFIVNYS